MPTEAKELPALIKRVDKSKADPDAVTALREYFIAHPAVCDALGNLAEMTTRNLAHRSFADVPTRLAILTRLETMRDDLGYQDANELERSLIQHVVLCWLRLHDCELRYHMMMGDNPTINQANYWERKLSSNQRRYLRSCETLAKVRRLNVKIQVNVANQQIVT